MSDSALSRMARLVLPHDPLERPTKEDWLRIERDLGIRLPSDYKDLVSLIGSGEFGGKLWFSNPVSSIAGHRLSSEQLCRYREEMSFCESLLGIRFYPEPPGWVQIGGVGRVQFFCHANTNSEEPEWAIIDFDYDEIHPGRGAISDYILSIYDGVIGEEWENGLRDFIWGNGNPFFRVYRV